MSVTRSSDPVVQHREGPDLDALVEQIAAEHPVPVRFLEVDRVRRGGVMGFFAKEQYALSYQVAATQDPFASSSDAGRPRTTSQAAVPVDLDALVGSADAADVGPAAADPHRATDAPAATSARGYTDNRFADLLLTLAEASESATDAPAAHRDETPGRHHADTPPFEHVHPARSLTGPHPLRRVPSPRHGVDEPVPADAASHPITPAASAAPVRAHELAGLGVPHGWGSNRGHDAVDAAHLAGVAAAVLALPSAPTLPTSDGAVVVLVTDRVAAGDQTSELLTSLLPGGRLVARDRDEAVRAVATLRAAGAPGLLVVDRSRTAAPAATIAALQPELVVLAVEATGKSADHRRRMDALTVAGLRVDALAVERAAETSSPATVWELDVPVLTVDGRLSDAGAWMGLLLGAHGFDVG